MQKITKLLSFCGLLFFSCLGFVQIAHAQITLNTTVGSTGYTGSNSLINNYITFVIDNSANTDPMLLDEVGQWTSSTQSGNTATLWYSSVSLSGAPPTTLSAPDWIMVASGTVPAITTTGVNTVLSGLNLLIPAGAVYRFALHMSGTCYYSGTNTTFCSPSVFTSGDVSLRVGNDQINGANIGYGGSANTPRWFTGSVTLISTTPCSGQPTAGTLNAPAQVCANTAFTLAASGMSYGNGIEYQWEESTDGGMTWTPIVGATATTYTVSGGITVRTEYRFVVTCSNGGDQDISSPTMVNIAPFFNCYCPATNQGSSQITNITISGTTMKHTTGTGPAPSYYTAYPDTVVATSTLVQGVSYPVSMTFDGSAIGSIWIDYNQDGVYDATEWVQTGTTGTSHSATITVPYTALAGPTGMRVRSRGSGNANGATDACTAMGGGETEDYIITIAAATACAGQPDPVTVTGPTSVCI